MTANLHEDSNLYGSTSQLAAHHLSPNESRQQFSKSLDAYSWTIALDESKFLWLGWRVDYPNNRIDFAVSIDTELSKFRVGQDVFALGFSENGQLDSSDYCLAWYDLGHQLHVQDVRTNSENRIEFMADESSSQCKLSPNKEAPNHHKHPRSRTNVNTQSGEMLTFAFYRPLDVCDQWAPNNKYYHIDNGTTHLVWFTLPGPLLSIEGQNLSPLLKSHKKTDVESSSETWGREARWGLRRVQLITASEQAQPIANERHLSLEMRMDKYQVPAEETTYRCKLFKLPSKFRQRRLHVIKYEAVIEVGNEHIVHHMELFNCAPKDQVAAAQLDQLYQDGGWEGDCNGAERPDASQLCKRVILAWAMGAKPLVYPAQVGQPIGGHDYNPYVVLEVHYNNQQSRAGLIDSSGLRFYYTHHLRQYDAGILEVGLEYTDKNSIPPDLLAPLVGFCPAQCTRTAMATSGRDEGIYVFAGQMHTHLTGVGSWTELIREGRLVGELQRDDHYSAHFQEIRLLAEPVHVEPGDTLAHYCLYDTRKRANITLGGFATTDEMCVTYLHYYPRIDLEVCKSSVSSGALESYFAYLASEEGQATSERLLELAKINDRQNVVGSETQTALQWSPMHGSEAASGARRIQASLPAQAAHQAPAEAAPKSVADNYRSVHWSTRRSLELLEFYASAPLSVQCNRSDGHRLPGRWDGIQPARVGVAPELTRQARLAGAREGQAYAAGLGPPFVGGHQPRAARGPWLAAYRGAGFGRRHAQCEQRAQIVGQDR